MRNNRRSLVTAPMLLGSVMLLIGSLGINEHSLAQVNQGNTECEELKKQISTLQDALVEEAAQLSKMEEASSRIDKGIEEFKGKFRVYLNNTSLYPAVGEDDRAKFLENLRKMVAANHDLKNAIELAKLTIQAFKETIADLLNKLGTCGSKSSTNTPTSNPPENKKVALLPGYHVDNNTANGLYVTTFDTPQGKIKVNLTDDLAAGDTISGTVETEPAGKNDAERAQNQTELNGYVIELEGQKTKVGDKKFTCNIPTVLSPAAKTIVLQHNGQTVATTEIPISATAPPPPSQFTLPTGGQQGKPIYIKGPCDGAFSPQDHIKVGPTILPPVAESPRSLVVLDLSDVVGPTTIDCNENGVETQCPFRNIRINLSALMLNLQRGQTTTLHVQVLGLTGISEDEWLDLEDTSPTIIKMSGGEIQHIIIHPAEVQRDGTYSTDRTLTGIQAGGFGVTGTIRWTDVCKHPGK